MSLSLRIKRRFPTLLSTKSIEEKIEGVHDLHSLEILQNNLLQAKQHKENSLAFPAVHNRSSRTFDDDVVGSGSEIDSELEVMMSATSLNEAPRKPRRKMLGNTRRKNSKQSSGTLKKNNNNQNNNDGRTVTDSVNRPSSPDLELRDPAFFNSLLTDNGSPRSEPCFSFIFDPPYSPSPPSFWSLPNSAFSRGGHRQGSTGSYSTSTTPQSDTDCIRSSSLSLSSSTTRHSSEDEEIPAHMILSSPSSGSPTHFAKCGPRVTKV